MTIIEQPSGIVSAYDEQILEVIDTAATSTGYVTAKVEYHNGDFHWKTLPAKSQTKCRNTNKFRFNLSNMLRATVQSDYGQSATSAIILSLNQSAALCRVKLEHFELSSGVYTSQSTTTSSTFVVVNSIVDDVSDYVLENASGNQFLTSMKTQKIRSGEHLQFGFIWDETQVNLRLAVKGYPLSGSASTSYKSITSFHYEIGGFYGIDGGTLTSSPTLTTSNAELAYVTASDNKQYIGVRMDNAGHITFNNSDVGLKVRIHIFALATGSGVKITYNGAGSNETLTITSTGFLTLTGSAIPSGTTSIKIENLSGQELLLAYANILDEGYTTVVNNRGIACVNEYDATLEKVEIWIDNDGTPCSETLTIYMETVPAGIRLGWLNSEGSYDHYTFTDVYTISGSSERKKIESASGINITDSRKTDVYTIYTFFEDETKLDWLSEIVSSPDVYLVNAYNDKVSIDVISGSFPKQTPELSQAEVSFMLSQYSTVQNG